MDRFIFGYIFKQFFPRNWTLFFFYSMSAYRKFKLWKRKVNAIKRSKIPVSGYKDILNSRQIVPKKDISVKTPWHQKLARSGSMGSWSLKGFENWYVFMIKTEVSKKRRFRKTTVCSVLLPSDANRFYNVASLKTFNGKVAWPKKLSNVSGAGLRKTFSHMSSWFLLGRIKAMDL